MFARGVTGGGITGGGITGGGREGGASFGCAGVLCDKILHFKEQNREPTARGAPHFGLKHTKAGGALALSLGGGLVSCGTSSFGTFGIDCDRGEIFSLFEDNGGFDPAESGRFEEGGK